jgi:hypothetical protein
MKHAPVFDNGLSLFNYGMADDLKNLTEYRKTRLAHNIESFDNNVKLFCGKQQKEQLKKLIGFTFTPHEKYNWESERYKIIEDFIGQRVLELYNAI